MSRIRLLSLGVAATLCAVILTGCATTPSQVNSISLKSHKTERVYGPFDYANETEVLIGKSAFTMIVDKDLEETCSFKLKSGKTQRIYGPFKARSGKDIKIGKSDFTIKDVQ